MRRLRWRRGWLVGVPLVILVAAGVGIAATGGGQARPKACLPYAVSQRQIAAVGRSTARPRPLPDFSHVVVILMENRECGQVVGSPEAPFANSLGRRYAMLPDLYATAHPSFPNYLALISGSTMGARATCAKCRYGARNLVDLLEAANLSWKAYMENMPSPCYGPTRAGLYAKRHNPFLFFTDITRDPRRCSHVVPFAQLARDEHAGTLPRFSWITPNLCHDMHNCDVAAGDAFLARTVPPLLRAVGPRGAIFITWDEGTTKRSCCGGHAAGGNIPTFVAGGAVRPHAAPLTAYDSLSILRTIEDAWRLPRLGATGCRCTPVIDDIWRRRS
ncbi:MAG TPA: alkaline phosphatase family protein [Solirubrobacteraceae bacterium]